MSRCIEELVKGILTGDIAADSLSNDELVGVAAFMELMKAKTLTPEQQKKNREKWIKERNTAVLEDLNVDRPAKIPATTKPKKVKHLTVIKEEGGAEKIDYSDRGQWKISKGEVLEKPPVSEAQRKAMWAAAGGKSNIGIPETVGRDYAESDPGGKLPEKISKAIKPGPTLDYSKINPKPNYAEIEANAPTINYKDSTKKPKQGTGVAERASEVRQEIENEAGETALDTIARRRKMKKEEGVNEDSEPTSAQVTRMTAKADGVTAQPTMMGPGPQGSPDVATMGKQERCKISDRGQWSIEKKDR